jgi:LETM1 and EF-hand domain-containing protein 1
MLRLKLPLSRFFSSHHSLHFPSLFSFSKKRKKPEAEPESKSEASKHALIPAQENKIIVYAKEMYHTVKQGGKKSWEDMKLYRRVLKQRGRNISLWTAYEIHEIRRIKKEILKLLPFTFFIVVPFAEFLLPAYLLLFPNAYPTHFFTPNQKKEQMKKLEKKQYEAHKVLIEYLKSSLIVNSVDIHDLLEKDILKLRKLFEENKAFIDEYLNLKNMDSDTLMLFINYLNIEVITGTHLVNEIVRYSIHMPRFLMNILLFITRSKKRIIWNHWILNYQIKANFRPFEYLKKKFLLFQIERNIKHLKNQDSAFDQYGFDYGSSEINPDFMLDFGRERGFRSAEEDDLEVEEFMKKNWIPAVKVPISNSLYIWQTVLNFKT